MEGAPKFDTTLSTSERYDESKGLEIGRRYAEAKNSLEIKKRQIAELEEEAKNLGNPSHPCG